MNKNKPQLLEYLKSLNFMSVATYNKHLWAASVYYVVDKDFNLYFISQPDTEHCQDILKNSEVACTIADSRQKVTAKKVGVQLYGTAKQLTAMEKLKWMLAFWNRMNPGVASVINLKNIQNKVIKSRAYQITPKKIKWFNEELYGSEGVEVFEF